MPSFSKITSYSDNNPFRASEPTQHDTEYVTDLMTKLSNGEPIIDILAGMCIEQSSIEELDMVLAFLINFSCDLFKNVTSSKLSQTKENIRNIALVFSALRPDDDIPVMSRIWINKSIPKETKLIFRKAFDDVSLTEMYMSVMFKPNQELVMDVVKSLYNLFPEFDEWQVLKIMLDEDKQERSNIDGTEAESLLVEDWVKDKLKGDTKNKPTWVREYSGEIGEIIDLYQDNPVDDAETMLSNMKIKLPKLGLEDGIGNNDDLIIAQYNLSNYNDKKMMADINPREADSDLEELDRIIFREYGPVNCMIRTDNPGMCGKYGGCRMFLCNEMEELEPGLDIGKEWFSGNCDMCKGKIEKYWHAVRIPLKSGSWKGCYCGFDCMKGSLVRRKEDVETGRDGNKEDGEDGGELEELELLNKLESEKTDLDENGIDRILGVSLLRMELMMRDIGIRDRE